MAWLVFQAQHCPVNLALARENPRIHHYHHQPSNLNPLQLIPPPRAPPPPQATGHWRDEQLDDVFPAMCDGEVQDRVAGAVGRVDGEAEVEQQGDGGSPIASRACCWWRYCCFGD